MTVGELWKPFLPVGTTSSVSSHVSTVHVTLSSNAVSHQPLSPSSHAASSTGNFPQLQDFQIFYVTFDIHIHSTNKIPTLWFENLCMVWMAARSAWSRTRRIAHGTFNNNRGEFGISLKDLPDEQCGITHSVNFLGQGYESTYLEHHIWQRSVGSVVSHQELYTSKFWTNQK
ncbi:hypothetical protein JB92DRAFT_2830228 [Gautieria morchelliformis]|nr:hypothetical protein JB92DRAFT_2830228 [Gautieria morchelliformis]